MSYHLQDVLTHLDQNDLSIHAMFEDDPEAASKFDRDISWMLPQWITTSTNDAEHRAQVIMFDEICNTGWGLFYKHPILQAKLLALVGPGRKVRHKFYQPAGGRPAGLDRLYDLLQAEIEDIRPGEVVMWVQSSDIEDLDDLMFSHGIPVDKHKEIKIQYEKVKKS